MKNVTIIDDDPVVLTLVREFLESEGCRVTTCQKGQEALSNLLKPNAECPDLIMVDLMMPDITGLEVMKSLRADPTKKGVPIVLLSANTIAETFGTVGAQSIQPDHYLEKPFNFAELKRLIAALPEHQD